ncbi:MAG: ABC transporter permease [Hyphomicrobium sp.]
MTAIPSQSLLHVTTDAGGAQLIAAGDWTAPNALLLDQTIKAFLVATPPPQAVSVDLANIAELDTFGAWHLANLVRELRSRGTETGISGVNDRFADMLALVGKASEERVVSTERRWTPAATLEAVGRATVEAWQSFQLLLNMLGAICAAIWRTIRNPSTFRFTSAVHHIDRVGFQAIPIILLITFLIGCIIAQQGFFHFRKFGADDYVVDMVGILVLREIGVLIVAIMVAGRSGSSYTAELGSMKMREEIDALRTMGFDPIQVLVLPRVLALVIALPILTFLGSMSALYGGELVAWLYGGMSPDIFVARLKDAISITHFKVGMIKAPFMALIIGVVACTEGMRVGGSAESLGIRTTASVVTAIFLVIVLDGLFAIFFASIGM